MIFISLIRWTTLPYLFPLCPTVCIALLAGKGLAALKATLCAWNAKQNRKLA